MFRGPVLEYMHSMLIVLAKKALGTTKLESRKASRLM